ncbi:MAG: hypothetical protein J5808_03585 [Paludibacteraceae bacterium]|nr:hypothetical protein [Paludibacteraceae bacterium]
MKKFLLTTLLLLSFVVTAMAKFRPAVIETYDGKKIECLADYSWQLSSNVKYKLVEKGETFKIKSDSVKYIEYVDDESINLWMHIPVHYIKKDGSYLIVKWPKMFWVQAFEDPRKEDKYIMFLRTVSDKYGTRYYYGMYKNSDDFGVYCVHPDVVAANSRKSTQTVVSDCPELVEYLENKEVKLRNGEDLQKIIDEYNKCK